MSRQNKKPLFAYVFASYLVLAVVLLLFFIGGLLVTDIAGELERNNYKYYYGKVEQKRSEIENVMLDRWSNTRTIDQLKKVIIENYVKDVRHIDVMLGEKLKETIGYLDASGGLIVLNEVDAGSDSVYIRNSNNRSAISAEGSYTIVSGDMSLALDMKLALSDRWGVSFTKQSADNLQLIKYVRNRLADRGEKYFWYKYRIGNQDSMMLFTPVIYQNRQIA
ncbi:MAG: hypothetical protein Q4A41_01905, partial [Bacillota bacterium]|nr:hypothetical protein [Bacillota bacterium]